MNVFKSIRTEITTQESDFTQCYSLKFLSLAS